MLVLKIISIIVGLSIVHGDPLILTPYINSGNIEEARKLSLVTQLTPNLTSYSGFLTIKESCDSNLFFWFFPSQNDWLNDPVILWLQGGPGLSGLKGLLQEHGPYQLNEDGTLSLRELTINRNASVIYVDNPVGAGFSFTTDTNDCYEKDELQISQNLRIAVDQFFQLFPEISQNPFYLAGEGYGSKYVTLLAFDNHISENKSFNLQGLIVGNGMIDPCNQFQIADYLYQTGVGDDMDVFLAIYFGMDVSRYCDGGEYGLASYYYQNTYLSIVGDATHFDDESNILYSDGEPYPKIEPFLQKQEVM